MDVLNFDYWSHYLRLEAAKLEHFDAGGADQLYDLARLVKQFPHAMPTEGTCPYCMATVQTFYHDEGPRWGPVEIIGHPMRVVEWFSPT